MRCPCRKKSETRTYADCCQPYHVGVRAAPTAETLMRSRYVAFALGNAAYLSATWHPSTRPAEITFTPGQQWLMLQVVATNTIGDNATVAFIARSRIGGDAHVLSEVSRFARDDERWHYVDGELS